MRTTATATTTTTTRMLEPIRRKRLRLKKPPPPARVDTEGSSVGGGKFAGACGGTGVPQSSQKRTLEGKVLLHCEHSTVSRLPQLRQKLAEEAFSYPQLVQALALGRLIKSLGFLIGLCRTRSRSPLSAPARQRLDRQHLGISESRSSLEKAFAPVLYSCNPIVTDQLPGRSLKKNYFGLRCSVRRLPSSQAKSGSPWKRPKYGESKGFVLEIGPSTT